MSFVLGAAWLAHDADTNEWISITPATANYLKKAGLIERFGHDKNIRNGIEYGPIVLRYWLKPGAIYRPKGKEFDLTHVVAGFALFTFCNWIFG